MSVEMRAALRELGRPHVAAWLEARSVKSLNHGDAADLMERVGAAIEAEQVSRAPVAAPVNDALTFRNTKEAMLYAQRNNVPAVIPAPAPPAPSSDARALVTEWVKDWKFASPHMTESITGHEHETDDLAQRITTHARQHYVEGLRDALHVLTDEAVDADSSKHEEDYAYNRALEDAADTIKRILLEKTNVAE
jgi:hypothetical protein